MKNFVFDLYGTLVDVYTDEDSPAFREKFIKEYASLFSKTDFFKEYHAYINRAIEEDRDREPDLLYAFIETAKKSGNVLSVKEAGRVATRFRELSRQRLKLYPFAKTTIKSLKRAGANVYILSNAQRCFTMTEIENLGLDKLFDGIEISSDFGYKKPSPKFFSYILDKYSLDCRQTVYVGNDLQADVMGAKGVNLYTAYIKSNISPQSDSLKTAKTYADYATKSRLALKNELIYLAKH